MASLMLLHFAPIIKGILWDARVVTLVARDVSAEKKARRHRHAFSQGPLKRIEELFGKETVEGLRRLGL